MQKIYKFLFILVLLFAIKININALTYGNCDYATVAKLKALVNNVNVSYTYEIKNNKAYFNVILNNIPKETYFVDSNTKNKYTYNDTNNGEISITGYTNITDGQFKFYLNNGNCREIKLGTKYYSFPIYNTRYRSDECKDIQSYSLCKKWISKYYSDDEFQKKIEEYKRKEEKEEKKIEIKYEESIIDKIVEIYIDYYYYFLPVIIIICLIVMYYSRRKNKFKL